MPAVDAPIARVNGCPGERRPGHGNEPEFRDRIPFRILRGPGLNAMWTRATCGDQREITQARGLPKVLQA